MSAYTIAVIQPFLQSQLSGIKDYLSGDFNVKYQTIFEKLY